MDFSAGALLASFLVSTVGFGLFLYGKNQSRYPQLSVGLLMMVYPYFGGGPAVTLSIGGALLLGLAVALRTGM